MEENLKSFLQLKIIWKDDEMFELEVIASNSSFYGKTQVYDQTESLSSFAENLINYPENEKILFYESGEKNSYSYFSMKFYPLSNNGNVGVEIHLEKNVSFQHRQEGKDKIKLEIIVEPNAIDNFQKQLYTLAKTEEGFAILYGKDNRI